MPYPIIAGQNRKDKELRPPFHGGFLLQPKPQCWNGLPIRSDDFYHSAFPPPCGISFGQARKAPYKFSPSPKVNNCSLGRNFRTPIRLKVAFIGKPTSFKISCARIYISRVRPMHKVQWGTQVCGL